MSEMPDTDNAVLADLGRALKHIADHADEYRTRQNYYKGTEAEVIAHPALAKLLGKYTGDRFKLTYAAVPVDALMDRVDLSGLRVTDDKTSTTRLNEAFWDANDLDDDADDFHTKAGYLGDYYMLVWPRDPDDITKGIDAKGKHPLNACIIYEDEDDREPRVGFYQWRSGKNRWRGNLVYDDVVVEVEALDSKDAPTKADEWSFVTDDESDDGRSTVPNEWGFPMFHFRPDSKPYGTPVNERAYGPQDGITKLNATDMAGVDYLGFPQRYALLDPAAEVDDDIADDFNDEGTVNPPAEDTDPSTIVNRKTGKLDSTPGSAWLLAGVKAVGEFSAAESSPFISREEFQIRSMAVLTRTPLYEFNPDTSDAPSGEARRRADGPIVKHAAKIKGTFGRTWASAAELALAMLGIAADKVVEPVWLPSEVATDNEGLELVALKIQNGVPVRQALIEAGYTEEQVDEWWPEGDDEAGMTADLVKTLAPALQALGQAKTLGSVTDEDIRLMLPWALKGAAPEPEPPAPVVVAGDPNNPGAPAQVPTGELNPDGTPKLAPPKGVVPPALAKTMLPPGSGAPTPPAPAQG